MSAFKLKIILCVDYAALICLYVVSCFWGGLARTASGVTVLDSGLTIPVIIFFAVTVLQTLILVFSSKKNASATAIIFTAVKAVAMFLALWLLCGYALSSNYYLSENSPEGFYSNLSYTIIVILFIVFTVAALATEIGAYILRLKSSK